MCKHFKLSDCPHYKSTQFIINLSLKLLIYGAVSHIKSEDLLQVITSCPMTKHTWLSCYFCTSSIIFLAYLTKSNPFCCAALCYFKAKYSFMFYTASNRKHNDAIWNKKEEKNFNILLMFAQIVGPRGYRESYWGGKGAHFQFILRQCQGTLQK